MATDIRNQTRNSQAFWIVVAIIALAVLAYAAYAVYYEPVDYTAQTTAPAAGETTTTPQY